MDDNFADTDSVHRYAKRAVRWNSTKGHNYNKGLRHQLKRQRGTQRAHGAHGRYLYLLMPEKMNDRNMARLYARYHEQEDWR